jgi:hypothetical protein
MLPRWNDSERVLCFQSRGKRQWRRYRYYSKLWKYIPLSLSCQRGNIAISFTIDDVKSVAPNGSSKVKQYNTWDWKHVICRNFSLFTLFHVLPNRFLPWPWPMGHPVEMLWNWWPNVSLLPKKEEINLLKLWSWRVWYVPTSQHWRSWSWIVWYVPTSQHWRS